MTMKHVTCTGFLICTSFTGLEADTVPGSSVGHGSERRPEPGKPENLQAKYNFASPRARAGYSGDKKLAVMSMRQEIVDAIDQNQVVLVRGSFTIAYVRFLIYLITF